MDIVSILIGGIITWLASWYYYQRAAKDLQDEAAKLRDLSDKMWERLQGVPSFAGKEPSAPSA
jgi:hypothetical protein